MGFPWRFGGHTHTHTHTDGRVQAVRNKLLKAAVGREGRHAITEESELLRATSWKSKTWSSTQVKAEVVLYKRQP